MRMIVLESFGLLKAAFPEGGSAFVPLNRHRNYSSVNAHGAR
jgi:hypothetical protein